MVRLLNNRGEISILANVTERIMPGVINVPTGAWYDPNEQGIDTAVCANVLTNDMRSLGGTFPFNTCLVEVQKA